MPRAPLQQAVSEPDEKLYRECKELLKTPGWNPPSVDTLYLWSRKQRQIATDANIDFAARAYERGKRDGRQETD